MRELYAYFSKYGTFLVTEQIVHRAPQDSRLRSQKGGVEFINFPFGSFGSEICSEQLSRIRGQIQKSQTGSTRTQEFQESRNLIFEKRLSLLYV